MAVDDGAFTVLRNAMALVVSVVQSYGLNSGMVKAVVDLGAGLAVLSVAAVLATSQRSSPPRGSAQQVSPCHYAAITSRRAICIRIAAGQ